MKEVHAMVYANGRKWSSRHPYVLNLIYLSSSRSISTTGALLPATMYYCGKLNTHTNVTARHAFWHICIPLADNNIIDLPTGYKKILLLLIRRLG